MVDIEHMLDFYFNFDSFVFLDNHSFGDSDFDFLAAFNIKKEFVDSLGGRDNCIFLHVRRGNPNLNENGFMWSYQLLQDSHPLCKPEYYLKALEEFPEDKNVIVVSDLIDWCKRQEWLQGDRFNFSDSSHDVFSDGASIPYVDLCLMSLCGGGIIANSSLYF